MPLQHAVAKQGTWGTEMAITRIHEWQRPREGANGLLQPVPMIVTATILIASQSLQQIATTTTDRSR